MLKYIRKYYCKLIDFIKQVFIYGTLYIFKKIKCMFVILFCIKPKQKNSKRNLSYIQNNPYLVNLKQNLDKYLLNKDLGGYVISLKGCWGVGKTYFWTLYAEENLKEDKYVYISLFGINKIEEIKEKILNKVSNQASFINKAKRFFGSSKIVGVDINSILSSFGIKDFKDIAICFDDFERLSPNLNISEVLGLISELKEQYSCKVVIINNSDELLKLDELNRNFLYTKNNETLHRLSLSQTNNHKIFKSYLDKIVDIELDYKVGIIEQINLLSYINKEKTYINWEIVKGHFSQIKSENKITNLRLIKQYLNTIDLFNVILELKGIETKFKNDIYTIAFQYLHEEDLSEKNKIFTSNIELNKSNIIKIIKEKIVDTNYIKKLILEDIENVRQKIKVEQEQREKIKDAETYSKEIKDTYFRYMYDLKYTPKDFVDKMYELLNRNENENIMWYVDFNTFTFYVRDFLIKLDESEKDKYIKLYKDKVKIFIENSYKSIDRYFFTDYDFLNEDIRNEMKKCYETLKQNDLKDKETEKIDILKIIKKIYELRRYSREEESILNTISILEHKVQLENSSDYFKATFDLMNWLKSFAGSKPFVDFYNNTLNIYEELYKDNNIKHKMKFVLNNFDIEIEEDKNNKTEDTK